MDEMWSVVIGSAIGGIILMFWRSFKGRHVKKGLCPKCKTKLKKEVLEYGFVAMTCPNGHGSANSVGDWYPINK